MKKLFIAGTLAVVLSSCAASYLPILPDRLNYQNKMDEGSIEFSYRYDVLNERGNKKYAKKESAKGIKLVAVKVKNNTESSLVFGQDLLVHVGATPINLLESSYIEKCLNQQVPTYLLYLLLTPMRFYTDKDPEGVPIGYGVGPGLALINMAAAASANTKFKRQLNEHNLNGRTIEAGETVSGLIGIAGQGYNAMTLKFNKFFTRQK